MHALELKIPPVLVVFIAAIGIYFTRGIVPVNVLSIEHSKLIFYAIFAVGVIIGVTGAVTFKLAKTTVNPVEIDKASSLVSHGIFKYSRNPMYLAMVFVLIAIAIRTQNVFAPAFIAFFIAYMNRFQILPEERMLKKLFGQAYEAYLGSVRRWL